MNSIGGYFELDLQHGNHFHANALMLNTARNCLEYILLVRKYKKIYIPYYTCDAILEPLIKCKIKWEFYHINIKFEPIFDYSLSDNEAFLYTNYFGLQQNCIINLYERYGSKLIVDNSQAFFAKPMHHVDTFYSARKFFGVPDGAYLYIDKYLDINIEKDSSISRMSHLLKRLELSPEDGYLDFKKNEQLLCYQPIKQMSLLTERILSSINYELIKIKRKNNFNYLHKTLSDNNFLSISLEQDTVPMCYPYWSKNGFNTRESLLKEKVFVATYWLNVLEWCDPKNIEYSLAQNIIPLPIDQRYGEDDMNRIIKIIQNGKI
ncbi:hypothetical protein FQ707_02090 [Bacteroidaceae bacterium HV4-6-C5C]|nr:hypothetical protein FQ707_02090 [Bacteroidaceae bacterium HV4-6-C5C]